MYGSACLQRQQLFVTMLLSQAMMPCTQQTCRHVQTCLRDVCATVCACRWYTVFSPVAAYRSPQQGLSALAHCHHAKSARSAGLSQFQQLLFRRAGSWALLQQPKAGGTGSDISDGRSCCVCGCWACACTSPTRRAWHVECSQYPPYMCQLQCMATQNIMVQ